MDGRGTSATLHFPLLANTSRGFVFLGLLVHIFWLLPVYSYSLNANNITILFFGLKSGENVLTGTGQGTKTDEIPEKNQTAFDPLPSFHKAFKNGCIYIMLAGMRAR